MVSDYNYVCSFVKTNIFTGKISVQKPQRIIDPIIRFWSVREFGIGI